MKTTERLEKVPIDQLIPYARNARTHSAEQLTQLRSSLREYGFVNPVLVDKAYGIIAGHGRVLAAKEENFQEIPCVFVEHLTEAQKKAYILADNRLAQNAGWDEELLSLEITDLAELGADLSLLGFTEAELNQLLSPADGAADDNIDLTEELGKETITQKGDIWHLGPHRLAVGDSTDPAICALTLGGKKANLILTDPPYNVDYSGKSEAVKNLKMQNDKGSPEAFRAFLDSAFACMKTSLAQDGAIYCWYADIESANFHTSFREAGFKLAQLLVWAKSQFAMGRQDYHYQHEPCMYGWSASGKHHWYSDRKQSTLLHFPKPLKNLEHPTMKPIPLFAYLIRNSTMSGCLVFDPFEGSGTTLLACDQTERVCAAVELDEKYASVVVRRYILQKQGAAEGVFVERGGREIPFKEAAPNG